MSLFRDDTMLVQEPAAPGGCGALLSAGRPRPACGARPGSGRPDGRWSRRQFPRAPLAFAQRRAVRKELHYYPVVFVSRITRKELKTDKFALEVEHGISFCEHHKNERLKYGVPAGGVAIL